MKSHRLRLALVLALLVAGALWLSLRRPERATVAARPTGEGGAAEPVQARGFEQPDPVATAPEPVAAPRSAVAAPEPRAEPEARPAAAPSPERAPDLEARAWTVFRVTNERGFPVQGAEVVLTGLRTRRDPGSHYSWRTEPSLGRTGADGTLRLAYPVWVTGDDETAQLSFTVAHPDYATHESWSRPVAPEIEVVLELGSVLVVSGWVEGASQVITDVSASFSWDVDVGAEDWFPRRDGKPTTSRVPQGRHLVMLQHESPEHGRCSSEPTEFVLEPGETLELHLQLFPARTVTGRLDEAMPRPVVDGVVVLALGGRTSDRRDALLRTLQRPVQPDGTFVIEQVPVADAQVVALCRGWASTSSQEEVEYTHEDGSTGTYLSEDVAQTVDLRGEPTELVVAMEPTAALELVLTLPGGGPAEGVVVSAWPNACWRLGACGLFVDGRAWSATTDAEGRARIEDLPAGEHGFGVQHPGLDLPLDPPGDAGERSRRVRFESGATLELGYELERTAGD